jgi:hypothetical protein
MSFLDAKMRDTLFMYTSRVSRVRMSVPLRYFVTTFCVFPKEHNSSIHLAENSRLANACAEGWRVAILANSAVADTDTGLVVLVAVAMIIHGLTYTPAKVLVNE